MRIDTRFATLPDIVLLAVPRHRYQHDVPAPVRAADMATHVIAVDLGKTNVEEHHIGPQPVRELEGLEAIARYGRLESEHSEQGGKRIRAVAIVLDYER